jgi:hypothetical protein
MFSEEKQNKSEMTRAKASMSEQKEKHSNTLAVFYPDSSIFSSSHAFLFIFPSMISNRFHLN